MRCILLSFALRAEPCSSVINNSYSIIIIIIVFFILKS